jgi:hypothetical protein
MPSISTDWQGRIVERDALIGRDTNYPGIGGIRGLGVLEPRRGDQQRGHRSGDARGRDLYPGRILSLPVVVLGDTDDEVWANYRALAVNWRRSSVDLELQLRIPGAAEAIVSYFGRPNGLPGDPRGLKGRLETTAEFRTDPYAYGASVSSAVDSSSPLTIPAADLGDLEADTDRAVLTVVTAGGTPIITNTATGGVIAFTGPSTGTYTIDLRTQTTTKAGVNKDHEITAASTWFDLAGGIDNVLTFTGATSLQVTHRPAYEVL